MIKALVKAAAAATLLVVLAACDLPFGLGQPSVRALNGGAAASLDVARSFRISGGYTDSGSPWKLDVELVRPSTAHVLLTGSSDNLEAIITDHGTYFRGQKFLSDHMGTDPVSRSLVLATGDAWWTGLPQAAPAFPDFTTGSGLAATFLGTVVTSRKDHVQLDGVATVELSGPRADVFVSETPPYRLLRVHMKRGAVVDGISGADFRYSDFNRDFAIVAPAGAVNFADLSTLPPVYTVESVDTSGCGSTCVVAATLKNLGGRTGARAPSTVTFTMTDPQTGAVLGACMATVQTDVVHSATTNVSCTINGVSGGDHSGAVITAVASNPGRA